MAVNTLYAGWVREAVTSSSLEIIPVERKADLTAFVELPWRIYKDYPLWVPPLKKDLLHLLDRKEHPFWRTAEGILFLARRGSEPVGRIVGIIDDTFNDFHHTRMGAWGFFECVEDLEVAKALFDAVEQWVLGKGMTVFRGPLNPSTNYEVGMLVEGFDQAPGFQMPYNPPYYVGLVQGSGFRKEKDLLSFIGHRDGYRPPEWIKKIGDRLLNDPRTKIRTIDLKRVEEELHIVKELYDACWWDNWGFVPMRPAELSEVGQNLKKIANANLIFFVYWDNEPVAVAVMVPDINPLLKRLNGKIGLLGLLKILLFRNEVIGVRGLLLGIKPKYRKMGFPFVALDHSWKSLAQGGYDYLELGWTLEDNEAINGLLQDCGAKPIKRYRIFRKWFTDRF
jgi:GNAT superfamily N-acetyltransferase